MKGPIFLVYPRFLWRPAPTTREREEARAKFYAMYPNFDIRYWDYFRVTYRRSASSPEMSVFYMPDKCRRVRITKGANDKDPRWEKYLYGSSPRVSPRLRKVTSETSRETPQELDVGVIKLFFRCTQIATQDIGPILSL